MFERPGFVGPFFCQPEFFLLESYAFCRNLVVFFDACCGIDIRCQGLLAW
jgi:hypothetical protein